MIFIALPAFNEGDGIAKLLHDIALTAEEFLPGLEFTIAVVDDGSSDNTAEAARRAFEEITSPKVEFVLLRHPQNRGLAEAVKTGFFYCLDKANPRDVILTMDSDNSHTPGLIPHLVRRVYEGFDVVIASRFRPGARVIGLSYYRRFLSAAASVLFQILFPIPGVRDYTCGYRAYRAGLLKEVSTEKNQFITESGFTVMVDILLKLRQRAGQPLMTEVPLLLRYDQKLSSSKMNVPLTIGQTFSLIWRRLLKRP